MAKNPKDLNYEKLSIYNMKKRGQVDLFTIGFGVLFLSGVLIFGIIETYNAIEKTRYMFDPATNTIFDLLKCKSEQVPKSALPLKGGLDEIPAEIQYTKAIC